MVGRENQFLQAVLWPLSMCCAEHTQLTTKCKFEKCLEAMHTHLMGTEGTETRGSLGHSGQQPRQKGFKFQVHWKTLKRLRWKVTVEATWCPQTYKISAFIRASRCTLKKKCSVGGWSLNEFIIVVSSAKCIHERTDKSRGFKVGHKTKQKDVNLGQGAVGNGMGEI